MLKNNDDELLRKDHGFIPVYRVAESQLFIDGQEISHFTPDKPMFGIKNGRLLITLLILRYQNWGKIMYGHTFKIVSPVDDSNELVISGKYDSAKASTDGDIIFDGTVPTVTILFALVGGFQVDFEPIPTRNVIS